MLWTDLFEISTQSPTGLVWKINITDRSGRQTKARKGIVAGSKDGQGRWQVGVDGVVNKCHRIIFEMIHGEIPNGLVVDHLDGNPTNNHPDNLFLKTQRHNTMNSHMKESNTSGVTGVSFWVSGQGHTYARAYWSDLDSKMQCKVFSVKKYGVLPAFKSACEYREKMLKELNSQGAMYTERHGKEINE